MKAQRWGVFTTIMLALFFSGCVSSVPERLDGSAFDKAQYDMDEAGCRVQARNKFPKGSQEGNFTKTPLEIPKTDNRPFSIMEFNSCMRLKGWKNF
jgi:hypothetical protein